MRQILKELNAKTGITGSMVITKDGIMVAASLGQDLEEDAVAAFASSLLVSMKRGLTDLQAPGDIDSCTLVGEHGRISFFDMQNSYLVLVADASETLEDRKETIERAMHKIKNRRVA